MKFVTKLMGQYPSHLKRSEIKNLHFLQIFSTYGRKCKQIAFLSAAILIQLHECIYVYST